MPREYVFSVFRRIDLFLLLPTILLVALGLVSIYSATHNAVVFIKFQKQIVWVVLGVLIVLLILLSPERFYHYSAYLLYAIAIAALILVLFFGRAIGGNAGWFGIGGYGIQPSEFAKVATVIALARFLSDSHTSLSSIRDLLTAIAIVLLPWFLIFLQPDFGTGIVYWGFFLPMIVWAGAEMVLLVTLLSPVLIVVLSILNLWLFLGASFLVSGIFYVMKRNLGVALLFLAVNLSVGFSFQYLYEHLPEYQKARIAVFLDPSRSPQTAGYNILQSKVAIGSGGLTGRGFLQGSQTQLRFVPEQWTDFIFCVPAEEFGFAGGVVILSLFAVLFYRALRIARATTSRFSSLLMIGLLAILVVHVFVNVGMTVGLLPVIGIPLPFMSYGGSSFLTSMICLGLMIHTNAFIKRQEL